MQDVNENEILLTNRLLKNEVIETAETRDQMSQTIITQTSKHKDIQQILTS